jgi:hypothetical protein
MKEKKKGRTSKVILTIMGISVFVFICIMLWYFYMFQMIPDTLCISFFGFWGLEAGVLGWIKKVKTLDETEVNKKAEKLFKEFAGERFPVEELNEIPMESEEN